MRFRHAHSIMHDTDARRWLSDLIDYITASFSDPALWQLIQELAEKEKAQWRADLEVRAAHYGMTIKQAWNDARIPDSHPPSEYYSPGDFISIQFFLTLSEELYNLEKNDDHAGGSLDAVGDIFELLLEAGIITIRYDIIRRDNSRGIWPTAKNQHYNINKELVEYLINNDLLYNYLFGIDYIIQKYSNSVVKIEVEQKGNVALGTGWLYDIKTNDPANPIIRLVITNKHVLADTKYIKVLSKDDSAIKYHEVELLEDVPELDVACVRIDYDSTMPAFITEARVELLQEIITIGYPSVPLSREAYQLAHRGDVNAQVKDFKYQLVHRGDVNTQVKDFWGNDLLIISARTAPGSSGSPVIDETGRVVGMATQQLFEKKTFEEKGITPYSACIPAGIVEQVILKSALVSSYVKQAPDPTNPSPPPPAAANTAA